MRRVPLLVLAAALACTTEVAPKNPYDPATPLALQAKARITGTVETVAAAPFEGLRVYLRHNGELGGSFVTDQTGAFVFDGLTPGSYSVEAQAAGFAPVSMPITLGAGADVDVGTITLAPLGGVDTGALHGFAKLGKVAAVPGGPVEEDPAADNGGILVEAVGTPFAAVTTSSGEYQLALPPGTHKLRISKPSYVARELSDLQVTLGVTSTMVVVILATNPAKVSGSVVAELPGGGTGPLADALVTLDGTSATGLTNAEGQFTLDQLAPGSYLLRVLKAGYQTTSVPVLNLDGGEARVLADPLSLTLQRGAIHGQVALADTPADASGVVVEVTGSGRAVVTGADGTFAFDGLVAGSYEVRARRDGYTQEVVGGLTVTSGGVVAVPKVTLTRQGGAMTIKDGPVTRARAITLVLGAPSAAAWRASEDPAFADPALGDTAGVSRPYTVSGMEVPFTLTDRDGAHAVYVVYLDGSGGASAPASATIVLDRVAPAAPSVRVGTGVAFTRDSTVGLALSAQDLPGVADAAVSGLHQMELADNSAFTGSVRVDYNLAYTWPLGGGDGLKAIHARFYDRAGNVSAPAVALVTLDTTPPAPADPVLSGGAGAPPGQAGSPLVTVALSASDANEGTGKQDLQVRLANGSSFAGAAWQPYAPTVSWLLPPGDGLKTVYAQFMDPAGNQSLPVHADITLAGTAPTGGSLTVAGGAAATRLTVVPVKISATGAAQMRLSVDGVPQPAGWVAYATDATVDLGATPDEATRTVAVTFRNSAGVEGGGASATIVLDQRGPTAPSVAINGGAPFTGNPIVTLSLSATDAPATAGGYASGLDVVELSADAGFTAPVVRPYATSATWTFPVGDGTKTVWARFRDRAGTASATVSASVVLDTTAPAAPALALSGGAGAQAGFTATPVVTATLSATDANEGTNKANLQVRLGNDSGFSGASWQPYAATLAWVLPAGDGAKTVWAQFRDAAGNESLAVSAGISLVSAPPTGGSLVLAGGASATNLASVSAAVQASGAAEMRFFVNGAAAGGWIPYATSATVSLAGVADETTAAVSVLFRTAGGVEGATAIASILVDRSIPTGGSVSVNAGAAYAGTAAVTLTLSASDGPALASGTASGLASVDVSNDGFATFSNVPYATTIPWTLAAGDGAKTVSVRFKDRAGNTSATATDGITLDGAGPTAPTISLAGNAGAQGGYTGTPVVTATLSATDTNEGTNKANLQVRLGNDLAFSGSTWQPYATTLSWALPGVDGLKTVYAQFRDAAGNVSAVVNTTITLASTAPSGGSITLAGGATVTNQASVSALVSATGASQMRFLVDGVATAWVAYATNPTVALGATPDEAVRTVAVAFRNAGGVEGGGASTTILVDRSLPTGTVVVNGNATYAGSTSVTLTLAASDGPAAASGTASGLASVDVSNDAAFATFTSFSWATSLAWTLPGGDGAKTVYVRFKDKAGNVSAVASDAITLDVTAPTAPAISLAGNAAAQGGYTGTPVVTATLSASDANQGTNRANLEVRLSNDSGFAGATWQPFASTLSWSLPGTDGLKTVYAQFRDAAGNVSLTATGTITLAATPPSGGSITLAGGATATNLTTVPVAVTAVGAAQMQFYVNGAATGGWVPYLGSASVPLGAAPDEAVRTVAVSFRNAGGVEGGGASATILLDQARPTAAAVVVNGGAAYTASTSVALALSASDGPAAGGTASGLATVEVANNALFTGSTTYAATDALTWTLAAGAEGARTVWVRFKDKAGNTSDPAQASITFDQTGPTAPTLALGGNPEAQPGYTGTAVVTATLSATDVNEGAGKANLQVRLSNDSGFAGASWQPYTTAVPWVLPIGDGPKTVYAQFRDAAGNLSATVNAPITLDATPPTGGNIAVALGAASTNQASVPATISAVGAAQMQLYVNGTAQTAGWQAYATGATVALGATPDETTRTVSVVFRNFGGIEGGAAVTSILLDQARPISPAVSVAAGAAYTGTTGVTLALSASDGPTAGTQASGLDTVDVSNDDFATFTTYPYATTLAWTLAPGADGARTVSVRFKDKAGNVSATASDGITLDVAGPTAPSITLLGNATAQAGYTGTPVVTATLSATDTNEGAGKANLQVRISNDSGFAGASWQPYTTSLPWVLPIGDGDKTVWAQFRDAVGNTSLAVSATITLAETPPSAGTIALAGGAPATNQQSVIATLGATGASHMRLYVNGVAQGAGFVAYGTSALVDLGLLPDESTRTVSVVYRNAGGVEGGNALTTIVMDRAIPTSPALSINGGATYTSPIAVTLAVSAQDGPVAASGVASGLASVEVANNAAFTGAVVFPMADSVPWTLPAGEGSKTIYARFKDKAGNTSAPVNASIIRDSVAPSTPTLTLTGNTEAKPGYTGTPVVTLGIASTDVNEGTAKANLQVKVANDVGFSGVAWQSYTASTSWVLTTGDATKNVYVAVRDAAGNVSITNSASIQLLATPPTGGSIVLNGGAAATSNQSVTCAISASGADTMRLSVNGVPATGWIPYAAGATVDVGATPDQATRSVSVSFRNLGGVEGGGATASIRLDRSAPSFGGLAITGTLGNGSASASFTVTPAVTLSITPPGGDEVEMAVAGNPDTSTLCTASFGSPLWQPVSRSATLVLPGSDGAKRACVVFRDAAGNWAASTARGADITLDTTPPSNPSFVNLISTTQNAATAPTSGKPLVTASTDSGSGDVRYQCTGGTGATYGGAWTDCGNSTTLPSAFTLATNAQSTLGVRARDAAFNYSPGSFVQIAHDDVKPMPPSVTNVQTTRDSLAITWEPSSDTDVASYRVYYGNFAGDFSGTGAAQGPSPVAVAATGQASQGFVLTGLTTSYPYYVAVEAVDRAGNLSGPSGQRFAQPNDANPRLLSTYGGQLRSVGIRAAPSSGRVYAYAMQNQAVVQLDITAEDQLPGVTGRASLPNFVPDPDSPVVVFDCQRTNRSGAVLAGHCVVTGGSTLEGDFRDDWDAYRAPAPVTFFPTASGGGAGTVMTVLPARPHRVELVTVGTNQILLTVERTGVKAWDMAKVKSPRLLASVDLDLQSVTAAGHAWWVSGQALLVYGSNRTGTLPAAAPTLWEISLANAWAGTLTKTSRGTLTDGNGVTLGSGNLNFKATVGDNMLFVAWKDVWGTWLGQYSPGLAYPPGVALLADPATADNQPVAMVAGNSKVYVFTDQPPAMSDPPTGPYAYQVDTTNDPVVTAEIWDFAASTARTAAVATFAATGTSNTEHLLAVDVSYSSNYTLQRWSINAGTSAVTYNPRSFREVSPVWFAEQDRYVFISESDRIYTLDVGNPLDPKVVGTYNDGADVPSFTKLQVHGHYLYAYNGSGARGTGLYILKIRGNGALEYAGHLGLGGGYYATDFVVRGHWAYMAMNSSVRVYDVANPAAPVYSYLSTTSPGCSALDARPAKVGATTYEALIYCGNAGTGINPDTFQVFAFTGAANPTPLSGVINLPNDITYYHPKHVTVRGTIAVVSNTVGAHVIDVSNPASPAVTSNSLPVSGPVLFQGGYIVGLGKSGAASGPDFLRQSSGGQDGTLLFSTCATDGFGAGSLASANGVYYASCNKNGISIFAAAAPGGGSLLARADISQSWNSLTHAVATDGAYTWFAGPEFPSELGRLYSVDGKANPSGTPTGPVYPAGNLLSGSDAAFYMLAQDGLVHVFGGFYNNSSINIRTMVPTPSEAVWPVRGTYTVPVVVGQNNGPWQGQPASDGEIAWVPRKTYVEAFDLRYPTPVLRQTGNFGVDISAVALGRERLYLGRANSGLVYVYDTTTLGSWIGATSLTVTAPSGTVTGITGLALHGQHLFATFTTNGVEPYGLAVIKLGPNRDGSGLTRVASFLSPVPLANPTVAGDVLYVTRDLGLATYDLAPMWQDAVPPVLAGATVSTEPAYVVPRLVIDGPWGYLVGGTYRSFDLRQ